MLNLEIGKRYKLPHGTGVLLGHEEFYDMGWKCRLVRALPEFPSIHIRYIFELDPGHTWVTKPESTRYCAWGRQIEEHIA